MLKFFDLERIDAKKRDVVERTKDFNEIYEVFRPVKAGEQADRCIQCGDPYCHNGCPLHNFIPQWLKAAAHKDLEFAFDLSNETSPFPEVMGRICPHDRLCEGSCTLNDGHGAITIGSIETFISEKGFENGLKPKFAEEKTDKRVAIIGAGPAGLSNATFLLREGVSVEIFDKQNRAGGLLTYGIPGFKLDKSVIQRRVDILKDAGAVFHQNIEVGEDVKFEDLVNDFDAVFIGVGATKGRKSGMEGEDAKGVYLAMDFLTNIQKQLFNEEREVEDISVKGKKVVVIGGGDTAMDCVRTSLREKASSVNCLYRRDAKNMPGSRKEYINAKEEGVEFDFYTSPKSLVVVDGKITGINMIRTQLGEADSSGRAKVEEIAGSEFLVDADVVIFALGFDSVNYPFLEENGIKTDKWNGIVVDSNYETSLEGVFAGGDCHRGADLVVTAVRDGRDSAKAMVKKLLD